MRRENHTRNIFISPQVRFLTPLAGPTNKRVLVRVCLHSTHSIPSLWFTPPRPGRTMQHRATPTGQPLLPTGRSPSQARKPCAPNARRCVGPVGAAMRSIDPDGTCSVVQSRVSTHRIRSDHSVSKVQSGHERLHNS